MTDAVAPSESSAVLLHVFDLPQLYAKPSASDLLHALKLLALQASSWEQSTKRNDGDTIISPRRPQVAPEGVPKYLTTIIASQLRWIQDEEQREAIWEEASLRLAERSGRTAMPAMSRRFVIPHKNGDFELSIYEPSLTGDSLGLKTWAASYLLAKRLHNLDLPRSPEGLLRILELGSGTGLVGMAAAAILGASVLLTDLPEIESNLARNVRENGPVIQKHAGIAKTAILDWTTPENIIPSASSTSTIDLEATALEALEIDKFPIIVAADSIYSADHPPMLVTAINTWLAPCPASRVIVELPLRDGYSVEIGDFRDRMLQSGFFLLQEGEETGYDDWGGSTQEELQEVNCWWSIWSWAMTSSTPC